MTAEDERHKRAHGVAAALTLHTTAQIEHDGMTFVCLYAYEEKKAHTARRVFSIRVAALRIRQTSWECVYTVSRNAFLPLS